MLEQKDANEEAGDGVDENIDLEELAAKVTKLLLYEIELDNERVGKV